MIRDMCDLIKAPPSPEKDGRAAPAHSNDEIAAIIARQGSPLAGLEFV